MSIIRTAQAEEDLIAIWVYIAQENLTAADRALDRIDELCQTLNLQPAMGRALSEVHADLHYMPVGNYLVFYRMRAPDIHILRVLHSARSWQQILMESFDA